MTGGMIRPTYHCSTFNYIIVPGWNFFSIFFWKFLFYGNQKFFPQIGFTKISTMLKIYMAYLCFSSLHTCIYGYLMSLEKSISLCPPIRNKYHFNTTSDVWTFQISSKMMILNVTCHIKKSRNYINCDVHTCGGYAQSLNMSCKKIWM